MKILHALAVVLFLAALCFYVASSSTWAWLLGSIGAFLEIAAWVIALICKERATPDSGTT